MIRILCPCLILAGCINTQHAVHVEAGQVEIYVRLEW